jgi:hypothetical protein
MFAYVAPRGLDGSRLNARNAARLDSHAEATVSMRAPVLGGGVASGTRRRAA